jgi:CRP/FNR family transcriptional regulator
MNLKDIYLFKHLSEPQLKMLKRISTHKEYKKDNILFLEGERSERLNILIEGMLKVYKSDKAGNEIVLNIFYPTTLVAEIACLEHIPYPATAVFETDGKVISIDYAAFENDFLLNPEISLSIIKSLAHKIKALDKVITQNLTMDSTARAAKFIYENDKLFMKLKQNKVAAILNITPETMSRIMKKFKTAEIVDLKKGILNKEALKSLFE